MNTNPAVLTKINPSHKIRALLVDDSPLMLKVTAEILKQAGNFEVVGSACNGYQALRQVRILSPDLVVTDVHMPRLDGIQATRYLKRSERPPIVVVVTSDDSPVTRAAAELAGADGFVCKDFKFRQQLIDALQKIFSPPQNTPDFVHGEPGVCCLTCNEKSEHEQTPTIHQCRRCVSVRIATSPGTNPPVPDRRLRRTWRNGTHEPARLFNLEQKLRTISK